MSTLIVIAIGAFLGLSFAKAAYFPSRSSRAVVVDNRPRLSV